VTFSFLRRNLGVHRLAILLSVYGFWLAPPVSGRSSPPRAVIEALAGR
jgi:hypothetical protein